MQWDRFKKKITENKAFRKKLARESFYWFSHIYFPHYIKHPTAGFQKNIYEVLSSWDKKFIEILAFRGSAKSTISMLFFPIWSIIIGKAKFPLLLCDTFEQSKQHIYNLKTELENNELLKADWGLFQAGEEWQAQNIVLPKYGARVVAKSTGQKIRGLRHKQFRPDLCICDDLESLEDIRTKEQRDKTYFWFLGDVLPALSDEAKIVLIGNLLHSDSLMMRIKKQIESGSREGIKLEFSFLDEKGNSLWTEKFLNNEAVEREKAKINDYRTWQREYLLRIVPEAGQEVKDDWIQFYDHLPSEEAITYQGTGIDLAISKKETANYTALVSGKLAMIDGQPKIYIMPNPTNERLSLHETLEKSRAVSIALGNGSLTNLFIEQVSYQEAMIGEAQRLGLPAEGVKVSMDKRARLRTVASFVQNGIVLFPKRGCEDLIIQLTGFGVEAYDDLCDAFVLLVQALMNRAASGEPRITILEFGEDDKEEPNPEPIKERKFKFGHSREWYEQQAMKHPS